MTTEPVDAETALDELYAFLDRNGATKLLAYMIERLIDAKVAEAIEELRGDIEAATGIRP